MTQSPNLLQGPEPVETADLHFKLLCKLKVFHPTTKYNSGNYSLVAASQYYGLIFVGSSSGVTVIQAKCINSTTSFNEFPRKDICFSSKPSHISVDFTQKFLSVVCSSQGAVLYIYNIGSLASSDVVPFRVFELSKLISNLAAEVADVMWQPNADGLLMICMSDGSVLSINPNSKDSSVYTLPKSTQAMCFCWSPKGKQIIVGCGNGTLCQYKPDLKLVKTIPAPPLFNGAVTVVSVLWISNYQFAVAYNEKNNPSAFPITTIVNAVKNEPVNVINYDDVTYSSSLMRKHQVYMSHQSAWNIILIGSANGIEVAVLHTKENSTWEQWLLGDASRAELPLNAARQETFPIGMAYDFTAVDSIPWGEGSLPPMPRLLLLSDEGVLCVFNIVNLNTNAPQLCGPPKAQLEDSAFTVKSMPVTNSPSAVPVAVSVGQQNSVSTSQPLPVQSSFGNAKPTFSFDTNKTFGGFTMQPQNASPQVMVSFPATGIVGGFKDTTSSPQQQQKQVQSQQQVQAQQQQQQQPQIQIQFKSSPQQPSMGSVPQIPVSSSQNITQKFTTSAPRFGTPAVPTFTFKTPGFGIKPTTTQSEVDFAASVPSVQAKGVAVKLQGPTAASEPKSSDQADIFSTKMNLPQSTPIKGATVQVPETVQVKPTTEKAPEPKAEETSSKAKPSSGTSSPLPEVPVVDDSVYWNALQDEIDHFNSELQLLSKKFGSLDFKVGTEDQKVKMRKNLDELNEFWKELKDTTVSQSGEIHAVLTDLMESFAWLEDAKSRNIQRKNPGFIELKRSEALDPISARHMSEIGHLKYYMENQLQQLTKHLEKEWMDHQDSYRTDVKTQMAVPSLEEIYKTIHYQLKILNKQRAVVEELHSRLTAKKRKNKSMSSFVENSAGGSAPDRGSRRALELSKLADNLLQLEIGREERGTPFENWEAVKVQLKTIADRSKKLTSDKQAALRDILSERDMVRIRPVKTTIERSSFLRTLALEKSSARKAAAANAKDVEKVKTPQSPTKRKTPVSPKPKVDVKSKSESKENVELTKKQSQQQQQEPGEAKFVFGGAGAPAAEPAIANKSTDQPARSPATAVVFGTTKEAVSKASEIPKPNLNLFTLSTIDSKPQKKPEETKPLQTFTFDSSKPPAGSLFGGTLPPAPKLGEGKSIFGSGLTSSAGQTNLLKSDAAVGNSAATTAVAASSATAPASFTFSFASTPAPTASSTPLPKLNLVFNGKTQVSGFGGTTTSAQKLTSLPPLAGAAPPVDSGKFSDSKTPATTAASAVVTTAAQTTSFTFSNAGETKAATTTEVSGAIKVPEPQNEEVDVVSVEDSKKPEEPKVSESKLPPQVTSIFGGAAAQVKPQTEPAVPAIPASSSSVQVTSTTLNLTMSTLAKPTTASPISFGSPSSVFGQATTAASSAAPPVAVAAASSSSPAVTTFSFATTTSSFVFGQATTASPTVATVTPTTTTASVTTTTATSGLFQQSPSSTTPVAQVSSTTPIFSAATTTGSIFGGSTTTSTSIFGQVSSAASTPKSSSIFANSNLTPTTNAFGQATTPTSSSSAFSDSVSQTTNIFGQLLSESNRSDGNLFATSSATATTTANIFSTPKNIFGGTVTSPPQTTTAFGASGSSAIFGQSNQSFFGTGGGSTSVTSNQSGFGSKPIFGQSVFGQTTSNTSVFGGSTSSIFGGSSTTSPGGSNVFQTTTTSFGTTAPGPFSSNQGSVAATGFKASGTFQKPLGGFGSPPVFGGRPTTTPAFGASPTFSGAATFGSQPIFGTRTGAFETSQGTFTQPQGSTTFENLANQNTVGFGNLAQQSQTQGFGGFTAAPAFENKPAFGGTSFSSWRSS